MGIDRRLMDRQRPLNRSLLLAITFDGRPHVVAEVGQVRRGQTTSGNDGHGGLLGFNIKTPQHRAEVFANYQMEAGEEMAQRDALSRKARGPSTRWGTPAGGDELAQSIETCVIKFIAALQSRWQGRGMLKGAAHAFRPESPWCR